MFYVVQHYGYPNCVQCLPGREGGGADTVMIGQLLNIKFLKISENWNDNFSAIQRCYYSNCLEFNPEHY